MQTLFISYSRKDTPFVRRLHEALAAQDRETWVDWEGIPPSAEWMKEILGAIDTAGAFVFILSPDSVTSAVCRDELVHAVAQNKRLIPVIRHDVDAALVPEALAKMNWIFFREQDDFDTSLKTLVTAVDTDLDWVQAHTRLLVRARDWDARGRENSLALRGKDLEMAEEWLTLGPTKQPQPTELQTLYVLGSRKVATNRRYMLLGSVTIALVAVAILATTTYFGRREAARQQTIAVAGRLTGDAELLRNQAAGPPGDNDLAERSVLLATEATGTLARLGIRSLQTDIAMRRSLALLPNRVHQFAYENGIYFKEMVMTNERLVAVARDPLAVGHWLVNGVEVLRKQADGVAEAVTISPDGKFIATVAFAHAQGRVDIWDTTNLERLASIQGVAGTIGTIALSPDAKYLVTNANLWNAEKSQWLPQPTRVWLRSDRELRELATLPSTHGVTFSPDGAWLAGTVDNKLRVWAVPMTPAGQFEEAQLPLIRVSSPSFSADGKQLLLSRADRLTTLSVGTWQKLHEITYDGGVWALSAEGRFIAVSVEGNSNVVILDAADGHEVVRFHVSSLEAVAFSPSSRTVAIANRGHEVDVFRIVPGGSDIAQLSIGTEIEDMAFGADESSLVTVATSTNGIVKRQWSWSTADEAPRPAVELRGQSATLSADAQFIAVADGQKLIVVNSADGRTVREMSLPADAQAIRLSPDGSFVAAATDDKTEEKTVLLWPTDGEGQAQRFTVNAKVAPRELAVGVSGSPLIAVASDGITRAGERFLTHVWQPPDTREVTSAASTGSDRSGFLVRPCALSADARHMASQDSGIAVVKQIATGRIVGQLGTASGDLCAFSPDGTRLATAGPGVVRVWEIATQTEIARIETDAAVSRLGLSPKNRYLATVSDGIARVWLLEPADLIALACARATRNLAAEEKRTYFGDIAYQVTCPALPVPDETSR